MLSRDRADAKALLEALRNQEIHPVPAKSVELQTLAALHRLRSGWLGHLLSVPGIGV